MARRRKRRSTSRRRRKRTVRRLKRAVRSGRILGPNQPIYISRHTDGSSIIALSSRTYPQVVGVGNIGLSFQLDDLPNYAEFTALWDFYCIRKVTLMIRPQNHVSTTATIAVNYGVWGHVVIRENNTFTTYAQYEQFPGFRIHDVVSMRPTKIVIRKPRYIDQVGFSSSVTNYRSGWVPTQSPALPHFGVYIYVDPYATAGTAQVWNVTAKYEIGLKGLS